jgi:pilus assembly protein CpaB
MIRFRGAALLGLALVTASVSVLLAHAWLKSVARPDADQMATVAPETVPVVVAAADLNYGERLKPEHLRVVDWPEAAVPAGTFRTVRDILGEDAESPPTVLRPIVRDEPVVGARISGFGGPPTLAATIAPGMRAAAIEVSAAGGMARLVRPGDRVDVLITRDTPDSRGGKTLVAEVLVPDLRVLGFGPAAGVRPGPAGNGRTVTLEVTVAQAQTLMLAQKLGSLSVALRGLDGAGTTEARRISSQDLLGVGPPIVPTEITARLDRNAEPVRAAIDEVMPQRASVRIYRGLEASDYEVLPEGAAIGPALRAIDAAKAGVARP